MTTISTSITASDPSVPRSTSASRSILIAARSLPTPTTSARSSLSSSPTYNSAKLTVCHAVNLKQNDSCLVAGHLVKWNLGSTRRRRGTRFWLIGTAFSKTRTSTANTRIPRPSAVVRLGQSSLSYISFMLDMLFLSNRMEKGW